MISSVPLQERCDFPQDNEYEASQSLNISTDKGEPVKFILLNNIQWGLENNLAGKIYKHEKDHRHIIII